MLPMLHHSENHYFTLGGKTVNVIETCRRYVGLPECAVA